ncbi:MAG: WYL domain-containing protein [Desulfurivibrio sp.]|nr:WYL domain-containing protein [Desulfurivibrio sp.]
MSDRLKFERFFWFHRQVKAGRYPNASALVAGFEVSPRTAQRDIEFMRERLEAPLRYDHSRRGYCYTDHTYELPAAWIDETNVLALALAVRLASTVPDAAIKDELCRLIERLTPLAGKAGSCLETVGEKISVKNIEYSRVDEQCFRRLVQALFEEHSLTITYHSPHSGITSQRNIHPLHLMHYMGSWHLLAWCAKRREIRDFALSRIGDMRPAGQRLELPRRLPPLKEYSRKLFGIMQGAESIEVVLRFTPEIAPWVAEQVWHPEQRISHEPDGSLLLCFAVADFREVSRKILSYGPRVRVIEPAALRDLVKREIAGMAGLYDE